MWLNKVAFTTIDIIHDKTYSGWGDLYNVKKYLRANTYHNPVTPPRYLESRRMSLKSGKNKYRMFIT